MYSQKLPKANTTYYQEMRRHTCTLRKLNCSQLHCVVSSTYQVQKLNLANSRLQFVQTEIVLQHSTYRADCNGCKTANITKDCSHSI